MGNFNKKKNFNEEKDGKKFVGRGFGGGQGGNRGFGARRDGRRPEMHKVVCSKCDKNCEVPFRPTGDKPVFCSDCFKNKGDGNSRDFRGGSSRDFGKRNSQPYFGDRRSNQNGGDRNTENNKVQFEQLNAKLDKILSVLIPADSKETKGTETLKSKKFQKVPKKETDTAALKDMITKTLDKNITTQKLVDKKTAAKKSVVKKKKVSKKIAAKKKKK